jgi:hypothetical protein
MPATLGGLRVARTVGTASFEVLVSPPSLGLAARAVGCHTSFQHSIRNRSRGGGLG